MFLHGLVVLIVASTSCIPLYAEELLIRHRDEWLGWKLGNGKFQDCFKNVTDYPPGGIKETEKHCAAAQALRVELRQVPTVQLLVAEGTKLLATLRDLQVLEGGILIHDLGRLSPEKIAEARHGHHKILHVQLVPAPLLGPSISLPTLLRKEDSRAELSNLETQVVHLLAERKLATIPTFESLVQSIAPAPRRSELAAYEAAYIGVVDERRRRLKSVEAAAIERATSGKRNWRRHFAGFLELSTSEEILALYPTEFLPVDMARAKLEEEFRR